MSGEVSHPVITGYCTVNFQPTPTNTQDKLCNLFQLLNCHLKTSSPSHLDHTPGNLVSAGLEADLHEPAEARGVVVADGLGVAESLEDGVGLEDLLLDPGGDVGRHAAMGGG